MNNLLTDLLIKLDMEAKMYGIIFDTVPQGMSLPQEYISQDYIIKSYTSKEFYVKVVELDKKLIPGFYQIDGKPIYLSNSIKELNLIFNEYYPKIMETKILFTSEDYKQVQIEIKRLFRFYDSSKYPKPVNTGFADLQKGKLTNSPYGYAISYKADGLHKFLFTYGKGAWLIHNNNFSLLSRDNFPVTYLEGEYIPDKDLFLAYDCLYYNRDITRNDYTQRMDILKNFIREIKIKDFKISIKKYQVLYTDINNSSLNFYKGVDEFLKNQSDFEIDGLIFTPIKLGYFKISPYTAPIYKWKPEDKLTIDLLYSDGNLFSSKIFIPEENGIKINRKLLENFNNDTIIEFYPVYKEDTIEYKPLKIRDDKNKPNAYSTVKGVISAAKNPVTEDMIRGKSVVLLRKQLNKIKKQIFNNVDDNSYLIDIGSGKGGDLNKWRKFKKIVAIEPDPINYEEFEKRSLESNNLDILLLKQGCCDDYSEIIRRSLEFLEYPKKIYVSSMISLSFFFNTSEFSFLVKFLKLLSSYTEVEFLFLSILGNPLKNLFKEMGNEIDLNQIHLKKIDEQRLFVKIDNSIVRGQEEYFVDLPSLCSYCLYEKNKFNIVEPENVLSFGERIYIKLFGYGSLVSTEVSGYQNFESNGLHTIYDIDAIRENRDFEYTMEFFELVYTQDKNIEEIAKYNKVNIYLYRYTPGQGLVEDKIYLNSDTDILILKTIENVWCPLKRIENLESFDSNLPEWETTPEKTTNLDLLEFDEEGD